MAHNTWVPHTWNYICEICGRKLKAKEAKKTWDGKIVCPDDFDPKHPQIELRGVRDDSSIPWSRPDDPIRLDDDNIINASIPNDYYVDVIYSGKNDAIQSTSGAVIGYFTDDYFVNNYFLANYFLANPVFELVDTDADFVAAGVAAGDVVINFDYSNTVGDYGWSAVRGAVEEVLSTTVLRLGSALFTGTGQRYLIRRTSAQVSANDL